MLHLGPLHGRAAGRNAPAEDAPPDWPACFAALAESVRDARLRDFYAAGVPHGDTPLAQVPMLAMDIETTGLNPLRDGIVSVGLVPMSLDCIRASGARHWIVKPRVPLAGESVTIHGITDSQVDAAPDLTEYLDEILHTMAGHVMIVHCRAIEREFLNAALRRRIGEDIRFPVIDTMELEARLYRKRKPNLIDRLLRRKQVSIRLGDSRKRYHLPRYRPHHAVTDALATAELLQAQIAHRFSHDTPLAQLWR